MTVANKHIENMAPYALADLGSGDETPVVSLAQNENPWPPSSVVMEAIQSEPSGSEVFEYPDPDWVKLRGAIAETHDLNPSALLCGAGSMELIGAIMRAYVGVGDEVLSTQFAYAFFKTATLSCGAGYKTVPELNYTVDVSALAAGVSGKTKIVCLANPGNPTGTRVTNADVRGLREQLPGEILLVVDEAYGEFCDQPDDTLYDLVNAGNTVILRTFSKAYALAGMRVGWGVFPTSIGENVRKLLNPNNIPATSQKAATAAMLDQRYMKSNCKKVSEIRDWFSSGLKSAGFAIPDSHTNFVLVPFSTHKQVQAADAALRENGFIARGMSAYDLPHCIRITIGGRPVMEKVLTVLREYSNAGA